MMSAMPDDTGEGGEEEGGKEEDIGEGSDALRIPFGNGVGGLRPGDSLPLSYRSDNGTRESEFYLDEFEKENINPYFDVVRRLSPTELIGRFMRTANPRVQEAVKTTVLGLLGSLPRHAFETTAISTGDALANLMFQLQMTGYMFKNAEYRLSLEKSMQNNLSALPSARGRSKGEGEGTEEGEENEGGGLDEREKARYAIAKGMELDEEGYLQVARPKVEGKIRLTFNEEKDTRMEMEVDAGAYMAELRSQVEQLQAELSNIQKDKEEAVSRDLLLYIKSMPAAQLQGLTSGVSMEVLESMRLLVETVMAGMGTSAITAQTLTQQTGSGMAQLCMWQLVVGYNLREMEAREDMIKRFNM